MDKMRGGGDQKMSFCPRWGYKNCPRRGGGQKWQNSVHVVVEWPLILNVFSSFMQKIHPYMYHSWSQYLIWSKFLQKVKSPPKNDFFQYYILTKFSCNSLNSLEHNVKENCSIVGNLECIIPFSKRYFWWFWDILVN